MTQHELQIQSQTKEKENLLLQLAESRQEIVVLRQDKEYLTRQSNDIQQKYYSAEEKIATLESSLDETKRAKELLYEKHISTRYNNQFIKDIYTKNQSLEKFKFGVKV